MHTLQKDYYSQKCRADKLRFLKELVNPEKSSKEGEDEASPTRNARRTPADATKLDGFC